MTPVIKTVLVNSFRAGNILKAAISGGKIQLSLTKLNVTSFLRFTHEYFVHIIFCLFVCFCGLDDWSLKKLHSTPCNLSPL